MPWDSYLAILGLCAGSMFICRTVPALLLKGRELPSWLNQALSYIPPAAFAALVANDLFSDELFSAIQRALVQGHTDVSLFLPSAISWIAAAAVVLTARYRKSLTWCIVVGVAVYGILLLITNTALISSAMMAVGTQFKG